MSKTLDKARLTMRQAAKHFGRSYSWMHANHRILGLKGYRIGGRWYFDRDDLDAWIGIAKESSASKGYLPIRPSMRGRVQL